MKFVSHPRGSLTPSEHRALILEGIKFKLGPLASNEGLVEILFDLSDPYVHIGADPYAKDSSYLTPGQMKWYEETLAKGGEGAAFLYNVISKHVLSTPFPETAPSVFDKEKTETTHKERADFGFRPATEQELAEEFVRKVLRAPKPVGDEYDEELHLEHWLRVLTEVVGFSIEFKVEDRGTKFSVWPYYGKGIYFSPTTGQPATEADYQVFNEIVHGN